MSPRTVPVVLACAMVLASCTLGPESPRGFALPPGDPEAGAVAFVELRCNDCHSAGDVAVRDADETDIYFPLGGRSARVTTYAELLTSIVNPSHRLSPRLPKSESSVDGESRMHNYNEVMTVQELIDLVAFLQPRYEVVVVSPNSYETYYP